MARALVLVLALLLGLAAGGCAGDRSSEGWLTRPMQPCPSTPNCVSSEAEDDVHRVEPLRYQGSAAAAMDALARLIEAMPRARVVLRSERYLHAEFRSRWFRFVDDLEAQVADGGLIHIRSASRIGYGDLGVNRRRVEEIRARFE